MKLIIAFLKLIRWPNLFFIALTQYLFYFCIVGSIFISNRDFPVDPNWNCFFILILASVFIAAAGYIINDYFDMQIDGLNKPDKVVVDRIIKRRWAIMWNWIFSAVGLLLSFYVSWKTKIFSILIFNSFSVVLLWFYSTTFKKKLLVGNILISLLTSWTIIVIYIFAGASLINYSGWDVVHFPFNIKRLYKLTIIYSGFAFIVSLIREVIKDLEDMQGDAQFNCKTMPIIWGVPASKVFIAVWIVVCVCSLAIIQLYAWQTGFWISAIYVIVAIIIPLLLVLKKLRLAEIPSDYHKISIFLKIIMLAGILSMLFFKII